MGEQSIGALWIQEGKNGKYLSGKITINDVTTAIVMFKNDRKEGRQPDYRIYIQKAKEEKKTEDKDLDEYKTFIQTPTDSDLKPF